MQQWYFVEQIGEPLALLLPVQAQSPDGVVKRFAAHCHLGSQCLLAEVLQRTAQLEVLREVVLPVYAEHRLALHTEVGVRLERNVDWRACIDEALVEYAHLAG